MLLTPGIRDTGHKSLMPGVPDTPSAVARLPHELAAARARFLAAASSCGAEIAGLIAWGGLSTASGV